MISEGMSYGSVEIATNGLPIILLKDAPTIGGYLKIGTVFSLDLAKLAQKQPNAKVKFELMDIHQAQKERVKFNQFFEISAN
jgi:allophanate hydrolase subunit 2